MNYSDLKVLGTYTSRNISPQFELACQQSICENLVILMEKKGLYQNIQLPTSFSINIILGNQNESNIEKLKDIMEDEFKSRPWMPVSRGKGSNGHIHFVPGVTQPLGLPEGKMNINFYLPEIETYCDKCKKNTIHLSMRINNYNDQDEILCIENGICEQIFVPAYNCGSCRENFVIFLIKRKGNKLTLCGRSSRIKNNVDKIIPSKFREIISDSLSSVNENDLNAGFYHLRTFLEHYIKSILNISLEEQKRGDELTKMYNLTLDKRLLSGFPSFSKLYEELSYFLHTRKGNQENFDKILEDVYNHLKAKELFNRYSNNI